MATTDSVPSFYNILFLWFFPICSAWGAWMDLFRPATVLAAFNPSAVYTRNMDVLFQQLAGPFLALVFMDVFLLRYTRDLAVWKIYQFAVLIIDVVTLYSFYDTLIYQDRLSFAKWEAGDWGSVGITLFAGLVRVAFVAELGFGGVKSKRN